MQLVQKGPPIMKSDQKPANGPPPEKPVPADEQKKTGGHAPPRGKAQTPETTPAEERGERLETGKAIARGGKTTGHVPGAMPSKK